MKRTSDATRFIAWPRRRDLARAAILVGGVGVAAVSLAIVRDDARLNPQLALPVERPRGEAQDPQASVAPPMSPPALLARAPIETEPGTDVFGIPAPPAPPVTIRSARPKPTVPAFAYTYIGRIEQDGVTRVFLARGANLIIVAKGDTLGDGFRVDDIGADAMTVTYLPLKKTAHVALESLVGARQVAASGLPGATPDDDGEGAADRANPDGGLPGAVMPAPRPPGARVRPPAPTVPPAAQPDPLSGVLPVIPLPATNLGGAGSAGAN